MIDELKRRDLGILLLSPKEVACDDLVEGDHEPIGYDDLIIQPNPLGISHEQHAITHFKEAFLDYRSPRILINEIPSIYPPIIHHSLFDRMASNPEYVPHALRDRMLNPYTNETLSFRVWYSAQQIVQYTSIYDASLAAAHSASPLSIGESRMFSVQANQRYSPTRVLVKAGEYYRFDLDRNQLWYDSDISATPRGWDRSRISGVKELIFRFAESGRRCPEAEWFEVIGTINKEDRHLFRILHHTDDEHPYEAQENGELFVFANDMIDKYDNNLGSVDMTVTRIG